jgi:DNA primase small subunit
MELEAELAAVKALILPGLNHGESLRRYYLDWFPAQEIASWLGGCSGPEEQNAFQRREFSFTLGDGDGAERFLRYLSYDDAAGLKADLVRMTPLRYEIGAVYDACPRDRHRRMSKLEPTERELVFDVDLDVYAPVMALGQSGADPTIAFTEDPLQACAQHWIFIEAAVTVLERTLRDDFGFQHILWVFSGRRGVHAWVCDLRARQLSDEARAAIVEYLQYRAPVTAVGSGVAPSFTSRSSTAALHPSLRKAAEILMPFMDRFLEQRPGIWLDEQALETLLAPCPDPRVRETLARSLRRSRSSDSASVVWRNALHRLEDKPLDATAAYHVVLQLLYPRLDVNVTRQRTHLLKGPFSVHPKTNCICVPFAADRVSSFRPDRDVPQLVPLVTGDADSQQQMQASLAVMQALVAEQRSGGSARRAGDCI